MELTQLVHRYLREIELARTWFHPLEKIRMTEKEIAQEWRSKGWERSVTLPWVDIKDAELTGAMGDEIPWLTCYLRLGAKKAEIAICLNRIRDHRAFLKETLSYLPQTCRIDRDLKDLVEKGGGYKWKVFLKTDGRSLLVGFVLFLVIMIIIIWLNRDSWLNF